MKGCKRERKKRKIGQTTGLVCEVKFPAPLFLTGPEMGAIERLFLQMDLADRSWPLLQLQSPHSKAPTQQV